MNQQNFFARILSWAVCAIAIFVSIGLIISAYSGHISPITWRLAPILVMTFPIWLTAAVVMLLIALVKWRKSALIIFLSMLVCYGPILDFCPIHFSKGQLTARQTKSAFTIMSYNVLQFVNQNPENQADTNEQIDYILSKNPDVVCIVEAVGLLQNKRTRITDEQMDSLRARYPYFYIDKSDASTAFLSKYKAEPLEINFPEDEFDNGNVFAWRFFKDDTPIDVFVAHLASFRIEHDLRERFQEMTTPDKKEASDIKAGIKDARYTFMPKIVMACQTRALQVETLARLINKFGGENTIICGDFNDPVGSYPLYVLQSECDMEQVYSKVGRGPMITYNANHFFFRIDHILYRGNLTPWSMSRGDIKASDHYPVMATFLIGEK